MECVLQKKNLSENLLPVHDTKENGSAWVKFWFSSKLDSQETLSFSTSLESSGLWFFGIWVSSCLLSLDLDMNLLLQVLHGKGFSPVWIILCSFKLLSLVKLFWHRLQVNEFWSLNCVTPTSNGNSLGSEGLAWLWVLTSFYCFTQTEKYNYRIQF